MISTENYSIYHVTNSGNYISWYDFAVEILSQAGFSTKVVPVTTEEYGVSKAKRPGNSRLNTAKLQNFGFKPLQDWKKAVSNFLIEMEKSYRNE